MASLLIEVLQTYKLAPRLGFCMMDNASDNDTALDTIEAYMHKLKLPWVADQHRLRCFGHVVNLIVTAFLSNRPLKANRAKPKAPRRPKGYPPIEKVDKVKWTRPVDAVTLVHIICYFIMASDQRIQEFQSYAGASNDEELLPIKDQETRWFSVFYSLVRALLLRNSIDLFVLNHRTSQPDVKDLSAAQITNEDWNYIKEVVAFMVPFEKLTKLLEHKDENGSSCLSYCYICFHTNLCSNQWFRMPGHTSI